MARVPQDRLRAHRPARTGGHRRDNRGRAAHYRGQALAPDRHRALGLRTMPARLALAAAVSWVVERFPLPAAIS
ncbi:hypothetical protein [Lentzea flava]|uniref:hypothetical protein n=1 Tax=Lentzea flava TaxID=103732 RepID=UPI0016700F96|nr:hypothetical protein [Lentzea flava]